MDASASAILCSWESAGPHNHRIALTLRSQLLDDLAAAPAAVIARYHPAVRKTHVNPAEIRQNPGEPTQPQLTAPDRGYRTKSSFAAYAGRPLPGDLVAITATSIARHRRTYGQAHLSPLKMRANPPEPSQTHIAAAHRTSPQLSAQPSVAAAPIGFLAIC
jgi:hypothetical protein